MGLMGLRASGPWAPNLISPISPIAREALGPYGPEALKPLNP